jgi:hypothetical protein
MRDRAPPDGRDAVRFGALFCDSAVSEENDKTPTRCFLETSMLFGMQHGGEFYFSNTRLPSLVPITRHPALR